MARRILVRVGTRTRGSLLITRETVFGETLARVGDFVNRDGYRFAVRRQWRASPCAYCNRLLLGAIA